MDDQTLLTVVVTVCLVLGIGAVGLAALLEATPRPPHYD